LNCPLFDNFVDKIFDHIYKTQKYSEPGGFCEKLKKQRKIVNRLASNLISIHFFIKMLNNLAKSFFLQWDFFFGTEEVVFCASRNTKLFEVVHSRDNFGNHWLRQHFLHVLQIICKLAKCNAKFKTTIAQ
jgi:hypothetical protein